MASLFVRLGLQSKDYVKGMKAAGKQTEKFKKQTMGLATAIKGVAGAYAGLRLVRLAGDWARLAGTQQQAESTLKQAMISMERFSEPAYQGFLKMASGLQEVTTFGDEAILMGAKFLMTYEAIADDVMPRTMRAMTDLAALMGGDMRQAANMLGKASMGMTGELRRVGVTVDQSTFKAFGFLGVLKQIEKQVAGQARALAQTGIGPWQQLANLWSDMKEDLGDLVLELSRGFLPSIKIFAEQMKEVAKYWIQIVGAKPEPTVLDNMRAQREELLKQKKIQEDILMLRTRPTGTGFLTGGQQAARNRAAELLPELREQIKLLDKVIAREEKLAAIRGVKPGLTPPSTAGIDPQLVLRIQARAAMQDYTDAALKEAEAGYKDHLERKKTFDTDYLDTYWKQHIEYLADNAQAMEDWKNRAAAAAAEVAASIETIFAAVAEGLRLIEAVGTAGDAETAADRFLGILGDKIGGFWGGIVHAIRLVFQGIVADFINMIPDMVFALLKGIGENMPRMIKNIIPEIIDAVLKGIPIIIKGFVASIPAFIEDVISFIPRIIDSFITEIPKIWEVIIDCTVALLLWIEAKWKEIWDGVAKWWENMKKLSPTDLVDISEENKIPILSLFILDPISITAMFLVANIAEVFEKANISDMFDAFEKFSIADIIDTTNLLGIGDFVDITKWSIADMFTKASIADMFNKASLSDITSGGGGPLPPAGTPTGQGMIPQSVLTLLEWLRETGGLLPISEYPGTLHGGGMVQKIPRLHSGLAADEVPAILQTGERVLSRQQNRAFESGAGKPIHIHLEMDGREISHVVFDSLEYNQEAINTVRRII